MMDNQERYDSIKSKYYKNGAWDFTIYKDGKKTGYDWDALAFEIEHSARLAAQKRGDIKKEKKKVSEEQKKRNKEIRALWLDLGYWGMLTVANFLPTSAPLNLVLKIISLIKAYRG